MTRDEFVQARGPSWSRLQVILHKGAALRGKQSITPAEIKELSELYRALAGDLMRVQRDKLGSDLERQLHGRQIGFWIIIQISQFARCQS